MSSSDIAKGRDADLGEIYGYVDAARDLEIGQALPIKSRTTKPEDKADD